MSFELRATSYESVPGVPRSLSLPLPQRRSLAARAQPARGALPQARSQRVAVGPLETRSS